MRFFNFWSSFDYRQPEAGLSPGLEFLFGALRNSNVRIGSVFGHSPEPYNLLYSGEFLEEIQHDGRYFIFRDLHTNRLGRADWFMGIPNPGHPRSMWVPHFYLKWASYQALDIPARTSPKEREFGVSIVASNLHKGSQAKKRAALAHQLADFIPVHGNNALRTCAPRHSNMIYHNVPDKLGFISRFTHHLCFENHSSRGYLTEKIFDPLYVGTVPLYAGDPHVEQWITRDGFLDCGGKSAVQIAIMIRKSREIADRVQTHRENLCLVPLNIMRQKTTEFCANMLNSGIP